MRVHFRCTLYTTRLSQYNGPAAPPPDLNIFNRARSETNDFTPQTITFVSITHTDFRFRIVQRINQGTGKQCEADTGREAKNTKEAQARLRECERWRHGQERGARGSPEEAGQDYPASGGRVERQRQVPLHPQSVRRAGRMGEDTGDHGIVRDRHRQRERFRLGTRKGVPS